MSERWRNADGTYNGTRMLSEVSGLSEAEIRWTFDRLKHLMHVDKLSKSEAKARVSEEAKSQPWVIR
jgi:hypothetical protein